MGTLSSYLYPFEQCSREVSSSPLLSVFQILLAHQDDACGSAEAEGGLLWPKQTAGRVCKARASVEMALQGFFVFQLPILCSTVVWEVVEAQGCQAARGT